MGTTFPHWEYPPEVACASWMPKEGMLAGAMLTELVGPLSGGNGRILVKNSLAVLCGRVLGVFKPSMH